MSEASSHEAPPSSNALSLLERVTTLPAVLLLLSFFLMLDVFTSVLYHEPLQAISWTFVQQNLTVAQIFLGVVGYGMFMSVGVVLLKYFLDTAVFIGIKPLWDKFNPKKYDITPPYRGAVNPFRLQKEAHLEQNKFYLELYENHKELVQAEKASYWQLAHRAFACLILWSVDAIILPREGLPSISHSLAQQYHDAWQLSAGWVAAGLVILWLLPLFRDSSSEEWVYCLSLYKKIEEQKRKAKETGFPDFS